jgi:diacylglycerol O-acyltransferase
VRTNSSRVERLTGPDLSGFVPEKLGRPTDIGVIAILDGTRLFDEDGRIRIDAVRERVGSRLHRLPRLRQVAHRPAWGLGRPVWVDADSFDLTEHVRVQPLAGPADITELLQTCADLRGAPLERSRPLWQLWLLPGLPANRVGLFIRVHHAIADGPAGLAMLEHLLDPAADIATAPAPPWIPQPAPTARELLVDNLRERAAGLARAAARTIAWIRHPAAAGAGRSGWPVLRQMMAQQLRTPRTSLNRPTGSRVRFAAVSTSLPAVRAGAHAAHATINDVVLAAVAGGLRDLLRSRGEKVAGVVLQAMVPVSLQDRGPGAAHGNRFGAMVVPLPVGEPSPVRRLRLITAQTSRRKQNPGSAWGTGLLGWPPAQLLALRLADHQHFVAVHVTDVQGPATARYFAGARLVSLFPLVPLSGNLTIGVGVLSYAGRLNLTVVADRDHCPGLPTFTAGLRHSLSDLSGPQARGSARPVRINYQPSLPTRKR